MNRGDSMQGLALQAVQREDAALGAAWRRVIAAAPPSWEVTLYRAPNSPPYPWQAWTNDFDYSAATAEGPAAALNALADALEEHA